MSRDVGAGAPHVLLVTPGFPPARGGVEEHAGRLAEELVALGWRVSVLTARRGLRRTVVEEWRGCRVVVAPAWRTTAMSVSPRLLARALTARGDVDVLHVHSYHALTGLAVLNPRLRGRVVFTPHYHGGGHTPLARVLHVGYRRLGALLFGHARAVICVSEAERSLLEHDVSSVAGSTEVIPNGVAVDRVRAAEPFADEPPTVLSVGRLEPYKGVARVVEAMGQVAGPAQLVVVGDGSQRVGLHEQATRLGLGGRVRLLGPVSDEELHRWLRTARVLVSASDHEAFGMAPLEAAAGGAQVVLSDIPAHREIAATYLGDAATVVDVGDPDALAGALRARLAEPDRVEVAVPSWRDVAVATASTYARVLDLATPGSRRVGLLDRPWFGHWSVVAAAPLQLPSVEALRTMLLQFIEDHPDDPLGGTVDLATRRWQRVPRADRGAHVARLVQPGEPLDPSAIADEVARHRPPADSDLVFTCVVSSRSILVYSRHVHGDGATFANQVQALIRGDADALAALEPRGGLPLVTRALLRQTREVYAGWARRGVDGLPVPVRRAGAPEPERLDPPPVRVAEGVTGRAAGPAAAEQVMTNTQLRALTRWRNEHHRGVSVNAVLAARVFAALRAEGVHVRADAFYSLFDLRTLVQDDPGFTPGNLAKSVLVEADLSDPAAVDVALRATMESRRALPALAIGALSSLRPPGPAGTLRTEAVLSFSSMPSLAGLEGLPWASEEGRRYVGFGYPTGPDGISVFAVRFRDRLELTASFDRALSEPAAVDRALRRVAEGRVGD